jgi:hypothetical protein
MKQFWTLLAVCAGLLALPAAASAQSPVPPPSGDNYLDAVFIHPENSETLPLSPGVLGVTADTTSYTTEGPGGSFGSGGEFNQCGSSIYGKTFWAFFRTDRTGRLDVTAAGFDAVIGLASFRSPQNAVPPKGGPCTDRLAGRIESFPRDNLPTVSKGGWYAVQVGGFQNPQTGEFAGGIVDVNVELLPPERVQGDAILTWRSARGGIKVTSIKVEGPRGSSAGITCLRKSCGRQQIIRNPKLTGVFENKIAKFAPGAKSVSGAKYKPAKADETPVRSAATAFKGRTVKNGARLLVVVLGPDQIGQAFFWDVKKNAAGTKTLGCIEPGGTRTQKQGTCDGK